MWQIPGLPREGFIGISYSISMSFTFWFYHSEEMGLKKAWYFLLNVTCKLLLNFFLSLRVIFLLFFHFCVISHDFRNYIYFNHNISNVYMYMYTYILKYSHIISSSIFNMVRNIKLFLKNKWEIFCHIVVTWIMYYILIEKLHFVNH